MAHLVQAAVWTAGLDDRLADSGLIPFQFCKTYAPPVGVKGQISTVCLYIAGGNFASKDNFILFYLGRFDSGTVFWRIVISPGKVAYRTKCVSTLGASAQVDAPFSAV